MTKDFYNVGDLSRKFEEEGKAAIRRNELSVGQQYSTASLLAIAQQLSVISGHLAKLIELCEKQSSK